MGLRWKIALSLATVALIATAAVGIIGYRTTSARLLDELDRSITQASEQMVGRAADGRVGVPTRGLLEVYSVRVLASDGSIVASSFAHEVGVDDGALTAVGYPGSVDRATIGVDGENLRVHTIGLRNGGIQVARSLDEVESVLEDLRRRTLLLVAIVSVAAALVGWLIAGTVAAPVSRLTRSAEEVGSSGRLDVDVPGTGTDEVGRLGAAFRNMLGALAVSRAEQQRLVQDAGHELRTPLTSLKTNLSVLRRHPEMSSDMRDGVLDDLDSEVTELTDLVNELVAVASGELEEQPTERIELAALAQEVAERVGRRRSRDVVVDVRSASAVDAPRSALDRALTNLVDNACKFDQTGGPIEVVVDGASLTVLDRGPGVPEGDEERIFDRFHRAETARSMPGSGLGLSIVREVVERAGGTVSATNREGGGAVIGFELPMSPEWPAIVPAPVFRSSPDGDSH
ncbi:MAG TPA: HAMP domain-containing sensor histidine kinase [Ilumatobacteraceae bacterium]|nr:HAMP domain-containing sensor histidine kinase [Ilumatobacteraceae bacterium]